MYAKELIPKNACIIEYVGRAVSNKESETSRSKYLFEITKKKTIDGKPRMNPAGYINHSHRPNAEATIYKGRVYIFAIKNIRAGEEITYDYGTEYIKEHCTPCRCAKCMPKLHQKFMTKHQASA